MTRGMQMYMVMFREFLETAHCLQVGNLMTPGIRTKTTDHRSGHWPTYRFHGIYKSHTFVATISWWMNLLEGQMLDVPKTQNGWFGLYMNLYIYISKISIAIRIGMGIGKFPPHLLPQSIFQELFWLTLEPTPWGVQKMGEEKRWLDNLSR